MLILSYIKENRDQVISRLKIKNFDAEKIIDEVLSLDTSRRELQAANDSRQAEMNALSKEIGQLFKAGEKEKAEEAKNKTTRLKESIATDSKQLSEIKRLLAEKLTQIPNLPHNSVPSGKSAEDNELVRKNEFIPDLPENPLPHWELGAKFGLLDFELGNKITGAGFPVYRGKGAKLQRALISFFLDENEKAGYTEFLPPLLVNEDSGFGTGQLPDKEGQMYHVKEDNLYLIPTAEVPLTNLYRDVILDESDLPVLNTAYTPCFRREAGSYGKDVRGLNRLHQFDKVEIVRIEHPDHSYAALETMVDHVEALVQKLGLPYRILKLCGGDMSFTSALTYDFEIWSGAQKRWLEVSSVSNFEDYQANRLKLRFRDKESGKNRIAHTLNGSALALPRIVAGILENNQTREGIRIPEVLAPYTGFDLISQD